MEIEHTEIDRDSLVTVLGEPLEELPADLYIPPNALEVILEAFTGPLDLLLYLIKKENIDILNIPIAEITLQYMEYVELMKTLHLELAAEYLVMAAMLAEIKSKMLLPRPNIEDEEDDPRADLIQRLREYERFKKAAEDIESLPRMNRELFPAEVEYEELKNQERPKPKLDMKNLFAALSDVMKRASMYQTHQINPEGLSVRERMTEVLSSLQEKQFIKFENMFKVEEGRLGVVVTFVAILELLRQNLLDIVQAEIYGSIYLKAVDEVEG